MDSTNVSIITPLHNSSQYISKTIQSVLNQTYTDWELLIVDDCSTDDSASIVQKYTVKNKRINLIQLKSNSGAAVARNTAIEKARGRYIAFLDSDDLWTPTKLEEQIDFMQKNNYAFTFTAYNKIDENGNKFGVIEVPDKVNYYNLLKTCSIGCLTAVYDTGMLGKVYMPLINKRQDYGLWLRILKLTPYAYSINKPLANYRVRASSLSGNKITAAKYQWKVYREIEELTLIKSAYFFTTYFLNGIIKTYVNKDGKTRHE